MSRRQDVDVRFTDILLPSMRDAFLRLSTYPLKGRLSSNAVSIPQIKQMSLIVSAEVRFCIDQIGMYVSEPSSHAVECHSKLARASMLTRFYNASSRTRKPLTYICRSSTEYCSLRNVRCSKYLFAQVRTYPSQLHNTS